VIELAAEVVTAGGSAVTNVASEPFVVPAELVATRRKWYVRPAVSPVTGTETDEDDVPEPALVFAVFDPYEVDVPYSTNHVVAWPFGLTVPPSVAVLGPTPDAEPVTTTGGEAVAKTPSDPFEVPDEFVETRR